MLLHLPVGLSSRQTAHRRLSGAQNDRLQSHRQWLAVTAPAGRAHAVERVEAHLPSGAPLLPNEAGAEEGGRRPKKRSAKKLLFIGRHQKGSRPPLSTTPYRVSSLSLTARHRQAQGRGGRRSRPHIHSKAKGRTIVDSLRSLSHTQRTPARHTRTRARSTELTAHRSVASCVLGATAIS